VEEQKMRTKLIMLFLTLGVNMGCFLNGQTPKLDNQKLFQYRLSNYLDSIGFVKKEKNSIDIDFRIWHVNYSTGQTKLIRVCKTENGDWNAFSLDFYCYNRENCDLKNYIIDTLSISKDWQETWKNIVNENLLNVRTQLELNKRLQTKDKAFIIAADGDGFCFEIATKNAKRKFEFSNIDAYIDCYRKNNIHSVDYVKVIKLINLLEKEFDWTYKVKGTEETK
jgi:hypothetical protein